MVALKILPIRLGCFINLYSHSRPILRIQIGARLMVPEIKSKAPPTPMATFIFVSWGRFLASQISCFGAPKATKSISALLWLISSMVFWSCSLAGELECVPVTLIFG